MPPAQTTMKTIRQRFRYFLFLCVLTLASPALLCASDLTVAVIKSKGNFPVEDILTGFKSVIQQHNISARLVSIEIGDDSDKMSDQIARLKPDILLCIGTKALERGALINKIPKLYVMVTSENAKPWSDRDDIFGVALDIAPAHQFRIIRQAIPASRRIGVLYDPEQNQKMIEDAKKAAAAAGFLLVAQPVDNIREIPLALQKLESNIDVLWAIYDQTVYTPESTRYILLQSLRKKIPMVGLSSHFAKAGALLAIYGDYSDMGQQLALQAIALSKEVERLPQMSRPRKVRVAINEKVGRIMDINFSDQFLKAVHQIY